MQVKYKWAKFPINYSYIAYILLISSILLLPNALKAGIVYSISKSNNAPNPIASGQPFTYTITYSWSGGAPDTLYIQDVVPSSLEVLSALPSSPVSTITGNTVKFVLTGLTNPSGSGTVQINARFLPGVTCGGVQACNVAQITDDIRGKEWVNSNESCVVSAEPTNMWNIQKTKVAGCAVDDLVIYRICITAPGGSDIGGLNLLVDSLEDMLPNGAEIVDVVTWWNGPDGVTSTGSWITLTGGPTVLQVSPYPMWYCTYVKVKYPSGMFQEGQVVENKVRLTYRTPCDSVSQVWTDSVSTTLCEGISTGVLNKYFSYDVYFYNNPYYYPTFSPGCCGKYNLWYINTGTLAQDSVVIVDTLSGDVDVNSITTNIPNDPAILPVTMEIYTWNGSNCGTTPSATFTYTTFGNFVESTIPQDICQIKWIYDTVSVNTTVRQYLDVCVRDTNFKTNLPILPGDISNNQMDVHTDTLHLSDEVNTMVDSTAPNIVSTKLFIGGCDGGTVNPNGPFMPGDTVRYRLAVANVGNEDALVASITDDLPNGFTYVGNETYFYGNFSYQVNQYNPNCGTFTTTVPTQIGGALTTPSVGDNILTWNFPVLPARCDGYVEYFIIEFDVALSENPPVLAGQHSNVFVFDADNTPADTSNVAIMTVNAIAQLQVKKEIFDQVANAWTNIANVPVGQPAKFKLSVINTGNSPLTNLCLLDITPWVGDISVLPPYLPRNSQFDLPFNPSGGTISTSLPNFDVSYNTASIAAQKNPSRASECNGFCGINDPVGAVIGTFANTPATTYSFKVSATPGTVLAAGDTLNVLFSSVVPSGTAVGDTACNSFAMSAVPDGLPNVCLSTESNHACVVAAKEDVSEPCLIAERLSVKCNGVDDKGNQIYTLTALLTSNLPTGVNYYITSADAAFYGYSPTTLLPGVATTITTNFTSSLSAGDTLCFVITLIDQKQQILCEKQVCIVIPKCEETEGCKCPFDFKVNTTEAGQRKGSDFYLSNYIGTSGANLKWMRATIISAQILENCNGQVTTYNTAAVFKNASPWGIINPIGLGTPSVTWESKQCDTLWQFAPNYLLDIPFTSAPECKLTVKLCIRYEFYDCDCNYCETVICTEIEVKDPRSGIIREIGLEDRTIKSHAYPNPITNQLNIDYSISKASNVRIVISDLTGRAVATVLNSELKAAGDYTVSLETSNLPSGVYIYTIETETESQSKQFVIKR